MSRDVAFSCGDDRRKSPGVAQSLLLLAPCWLPASGVPRGVELTKVIAGTGPSRAMLVRKSASGAGSLRVPAVCRPRTGIGGSDAAPVAGESRGPRSMSALGARADLGQDDDVAGGGLG